MHSRSAPYNLHNMVEPTSRMLQQIFPAFTRREDDPRLRMLLIVLKTLLQNQSASELAELSTDNLVASLVKAIHDCRFAVADYQTFKSLSAEDSRPALQCYAEAIRSVLAEIVTEAGAITIVSIGCGSGEIERFLDASFGASSTERESWPALRWVGVDQTLRGPAASFFTTGNRFVSANLEVEQAFLELAGVPRQEWRQTVLIASYAFHHLDLDPARFLLRCAGAMRVVLLEELATRPAWDHWTYRAARIGCDLLSNIGFNPDWAHHFLKDPGKFKVRYLFREEVAPLGGQIIDIAGCSPEMSVVIF